MTVISSDGLFEWDSEKDAANIRKHDISFTDAAEVFDDPYLLSLYDEYHSSPEEERYFSVGCIRSIVVVAVCHTERNGRMRIISARKAERKLEDLYYGWLSEIIR